MVSFPLLGWVALRDRDRTPLIMLALALLEPGREETGIRGTLELELPLYADTEAATIAALNRYGWAGSTWALGDPAPMGDEGLAEQLGGLLAQVSGLRATLLFAPDQVTGNTKAQVIDIARAKGPFFMPPLEEPAFPIEPERLRAFRELVRSHRTFFTSAAEGVNTRNDAADL
jgi:hypothetical protein